jgi:hypothetical protein
MTSILRTGESVDGEMVSRSTSFKKHVVQEARRSRSIVTIGEESAVQAELTVDR